MQLHVLSRFPSKSAPGNSTDPIKEGVFLSRELHGGSIGETGLEPATSRSQAGALPIEPLPVMDPPP